MPPPSRFEGVRCPFCLQQDDKVVDSRVADEGAAIRRRRECLGCGRRFTTYERLEESPLVVVKRAGHREPFDRAKVVAGIRVAAVDRPVEDAAMEALAAAVEDEVRAAGGTATSEQVGLAVLDRLRALDAVTAIRFASVYKGFEDLADFQNEVHLLKSSAPKGRAPA